jgi:uncharacterized protein DUF4282
MVDFRMVDFREMFQWSKFITPVAAPIFFWVATSAASTIGLLGLTTGVVLLPDYPLVAIIIVILSITTACLGVLSARLFAEFFLICFRTNDHVYALRVLSQPSTQNRANRDEGRTTVPHAA